MTLTRAEAETYAVGNIAGWIGLTELSVLVDGNNSDADNPLAAAGRFVGLTLASEITVTDADLVSLASADVQKFLDVAEFYMLRKTYQNFVQVNIALGQRSESLGDAGKRMEMILAAKKDDLQKLYGFSVSTISTGKVSLNFAEHEE